ncbi:MAG: aldehyde dehydrogenase family protein [Pseudomonadota bacterium]
MAEPCFINGIWREGYGAQRESVNPADGSVNALVSQANTADVDEAVRVAADARHAEWRYRAPHERAFVLHRFANALSDATDRLADLQMRENGKTLSECKAQVAASISIVRYYAGLTETLESAVHPSRGAFVSFDQYEPHGAVAVITPWNSPMTMTAQKIAPALGAGNQVILKPSELTPLVQFEMVRLAHSAGVPAECLQVLAGDAEVGRALVAHADINMISFTGGTRTGVAIAQSAADRLIPIVLELGGKSANLVFADADFEAAIAGVLFAIFSSGGQSCIAGSRLLVEDAIAEHFLDVLQERTQTLEIGPPDVATTKIGPMASFEHCAAVESKVNAGLNNGGVLVCGGQRPQGVAYSNGAYYEPTIITDLNPGHASCQEELFAPVLTVQTFSDQEQALALANGTEFGLAAGVWTSNMRRALKIGERLEAGTIWINTYKQLSIAAPFGGYKSSGVGREKGPTGLRAYQQTKSYFLGLHDDPLPWAKPS